MSAPELALATLEIALPAPLAHAVESLLPQAVGSLAVELAGAAAQAAAQGAPPAHGGSGSILLGLLAALFFTVLFNLAIAFFSGAETALISINRLKLKLMAQAGFRNAQTLQEMLKEQELLISAMLVGLNFFHILVSAAVTWILARTFADERLGVLLTTALLTPVVLIFGELVPKTIFRQNANRLALKNVHRIHFTFRLMRPLTRHLTFIVNIVKAVAGKGRGGELSLTKDDIQMLIRMSEQDGILNKAEGRMLHSVFEFSKIQVRDIMTPRSDLMSVTGDATLEECVRVAAEHGFSRLPVTGEDIDEIRGFVYIRDLFGGPIEGRRARDVMRPCMFVPMTKTIGPLLKEMQTKKAQVAIVVDEYGGTGGLCTIEDIVEVIVGDIRDEYDKEEPSLQEVSIDQFLISGMMDLEEFCERFGLPLWEDAESKTVGGLIVERLGRVPAIGETVEFNGLRFVVERVSKRRVFKVRFFGGGRAEAAAAEAAG